MGWGVGIGVYLAETTHPKIRLKQPNCLTVGIELHDLLHSSPQCDNGYRVEAANLEWFGMGLHLLTSSFTCG